MFSIMLFMFLFFTGFAVLFWNLQRQMNLQFNKLSEENARLRVLLRSLESRLDNKKNAGCDDLDATDEDCGAESLLSLSLEQPAMQQKSGKLDINLDS